MNELPKSRPEASNALWNPNAAANWSLLFSPLFGAYLHALNWQSLGETQRASASMKWVYAGIVLLVFYLVIGFFVSDKKAVDGFGRLAGLIYLVSWYRGSAKAQAKYVKERFETSYPRKSWGKPLLIAVGCMFGFFVLSVLIGIFLGATGAA
jgi:hypothetical protein